LIFRKDALMNTLKNTTETAPALQGQDSGFLLIIERGISRHPARPISGERFLIGAGSNCHLQLGGDIPLLHSIILPEEDHLWIDAVSPFPQLIVNGQPLREGELRRGDLLEIGEFVFQVEYRQPLLQAALQTVATPEIPAGERTAAELLELLEADLADLENFERAQQQAGAALQQTAALYLNTPRAEWGGDVRAGLLELLAQLHERARTLNQREATLTDHAKRLAQSQMELHEHLKQLCSQSGTTGESSLADEHRKSA